MKKKKQLYLILGATLILAAGYGLFSLSEKGKQKESAEEESYTPPETWPLTKLDEADVQTVSLRSERGDFTLIRKGEEWSIDGREDLKLNKQAVLSLLSAVTRITGFDRIGPEGADPEEFGLTDGAGSVELKLTDGAVLSFRIGSPNPSGSGRYVQKAGDPAVYLLSSFTGRLLTTDIDSLRDRSLPALNRQEIVYIKISSGRTIEIVPFFQFEQFANTMSPFLMIQPFKRPVPVDTEEISKALDSLFNGLSIQSFAEKETPLSVTGLDASARSLYLKDQEGKELSLLIGKENDRGEYYCSVPGEPGIFTLKKETLALLEEKPFNLTDHFVRLVGIDLVDSVTVSAPAGTWTGTIKKTGEETAEYSFQGEKIEEDLFKKMYQEVLYLLTEGEISGTFVPGEPIMTIGYNGNSENPGKTEAEFFEYDRDYYAVGIDGNEPEFLIGKYQLDDLQEYLKTFPPGKTEE